jgi:hypothetical protein
MCNYIATGLDVYRAIEVFKEGDEFFARRWNVSPAGPASGAGGKTKRVRAAAAPTKRRGKQG